MESLSIGILLHRTFWQLTAAFISGIWLEISIELIHNIEEFVVRVFHCIPILSYVQKTPPKNNKASSSGDAGKTSGNKPHQPSPS